MNINKGIKNNNKLDNERDTNNIKKGEEDYVRKERRKV